MAWVVANQPNIRAEPIIPASALLVKDLRATALEYANNLMEYYFLMAAYEGVRSLVELGVIKQHERESDSNYIRRITELFGFDYTRSIVDLFTFYLFKKPGTQHLPEGLTNLPEWQAFVQDCNLHGDSLEEFLPDQTRYAAIYGLVGFLVDKPRGDAQTLADERRAGSYPYISAYHPTAILDWTWLKDEVSQRPYLGYLKLLDDDGTYHLWWRDRWEIWAEPDDTDNASAVQGEIEAVLVASGDNPLGEIPFVWLYNLRSRIKGVGVSDVHEVARIDLSIIRDMSQISEITSYAAFPMMRKPMIIPGEEVQDDVGPTAILEFNPELGMAGKPDWLRAEVTGPVQAILNVIAKKVAEIYRATNAGGLTATETSNAAKSGMALQAEFQFLNANIVRKAVNLEKAENNIIRFWLKWIRLENLIKETRFERPRNYDVQNLAADLENMMTAKTIVPSVTFKQEMSKTTARAMLPGADDKLLQIIDKEIEDTPEAPPSLPPMGSQFDEDPDAEEQPEEDVE